MIKLTAIQALEHLAKALEGTERRVFVAAAAAEPLLFAQAYQQRPDLAEGVTFIWIGFPGANGVDWASLAPSSRAEGTFIAPAWRPSFEQGRFGLRTLGYSATGRWLAATPLDAALVQVSAPDELGMCVHGCGVDFAPGVLERSLLKIAHINPLMPSPPGAPRVPIGSFDVVVEAEHPLVAYDPGQLDPAFDAIADHIARLVPDGGTLQFGLGKAGLAALSGLKGRSGIRIHSGMIAAPTLEAIDAGIVSQVITGTALGQAAFYDRLNHYDMIRYEPVGVTHNAAVLAAIPGLVAVNSALEVDLLGQANAEFLGGRQISGIGGLLDFLRGAHLSVGGLPIIALNASAKNGQISRIVPQLTERAVSVPRYDTGLIITEFGIADLRGRTVDDRARALIEVAAPDHRESLSEQWALIRRSL